MELRTLKEQTLDTLRHRIGGDDSDILVRRPFMPKAGSPQPQAPRVPRTADAACRPPSK